MWRNTLTAEELILGDFEVTLAELQHKHHIKMFRVARKSIASNVDDIIFTKF